MILKIYTFTTLLTAIEYGRDVISQDGLHPNNLGHKIIAEKFSEVLKEYFKND